MFDWIPSWAWWVIGLIVLREVAAVLFGWGGDGFKIGSDPEGGTFGKSFNWHKREVRKTFVGWKPTEGGEYLTHDPGNFRKGKNGNEYDTPSGSLEYYRVIRKAKK